MKKKSVFLNHSTIALTNALRSSEIMEALAQHGLDTEHIKFIQSQLRTVQRLEAQYSDGFAEAKAAPRLLHSVRNQAQQLYAQHVTLSRVALKNQPVLLEKMDLNGRRKKTVADWMVQASRYYRHAATIKEQLAAFNITARELNEMHKLLNKMVELQTLQVELKSQVQVISEQRKEAYAALQKSTSRFFRIARIALESTPQLLEALGLAVRASV